MPLHGQTEVARELLKNIERPGAAYFPPSALPRAKGLKINFEALGQQILARKKELQRNGIPDDAEHAMVASMNGPAIRPRHARETAALCAREAGNPKARIQGPN